MPSRITEACTLTKICNKLLNTKQQYGCKIWKGLPKPQQYDRTDHKEAQNGSQLMMAKFPKFFKTQWFQCTECVLLFMCLYIWP